MKLLDDYERSHPSYRPHDSVLDPEESPLDPGECRGRDPELAALNRLLDGARVGRGSALVLHGPPGIGKTTLLRETSRRAPDFQVLTCHGVAAEHALPYSALHELLWPLADRLPGLPGAAADALRGLLRLGPPSGDRLAVSTAVLVLLTRVAAERPLLLLVDDADRLDPDSGACLAAVARRVGESGSVVIFGTRADPLGCGFDAVPQRRLDGLGEHEARELAAAHHPGHTPAQRQRLLRLAEGNPLVLIETPPADALAVTSPFADAEAWADPYPVGPRVRAAYADVLEGLSDHGRTVALLVAAAGNGEVSAVRTAATASGVTDAAWREALESGLAVVSDGRISFRNALIRAVVYYSAAPPHRRAAHRALAESLAPGGPLALGASPVPKGSATRADSVASPAPGESILAPDLAATTADLDHDGRPAAAAEPVRRHRRVLAQRQLAAASAEPDEDLAVELAATAADLGGADQRLVAADLLYRAALLSPDATAAATRLA
ncbi:AAA family ATPase, partial [Nocardia sp. NPDC004722]